MKKSIPFLILCFLLGSIFSIPIVAQDEGSNEFGSTKTEVNIAVANIFAKNNIWYPYYYIDGEYFPYIYGDYFRQPELVVGLKFHGDKGAFRLGTSLKYSNITTENEDGPTEKYTNKNFGTTIYLGYEWHSTFNRVNIFYGFDVSTSYTSYYSKYVYSSSYPPGTQTDETRIREITLGINPLVGVNVYITPHISVGTEVKFTAEYVSGNSESESSNYSSTNKSKSSGFRTRIGPLGFLSINIHF